MCRYKPSYSELSDERRSWFPVITCKLSTNHVQDKTTCVNPLSLQRQMFTPLYVSGISPRNVLDVRVRRAGRR